MTIYELIKNMSKEEIANLLAKIYLYGWYDSLNEQEDSDFFEYEFLEKDQDFLKHFEEHVFRIK